MVDRAREDTPDGGATVAVDGPIGDGGSQTGAPLLSAVHDLGAYGYTETEYVLQGTARADPTADHPDDTAEFATRMLVYRPEDADRYNGTAVVEWPNVSTQLEVPVLWINCYDYLMREGYAVVLISAQKVGVDDSTEDLDLVSWDSDRYADLVHPGDEYALDIFVQGTRALRREVDVDPDPLGGLEVECAIATGQSQSAHYLLEYVNEVQATRPLFEGFAPVTTLITPAETADIRDDLVPVLWVMTEDEAEIERRPDGGQFRLWEVPGASHVNQWLSAWVEAATARDITGRDRPWDEATAGQFGQLADGHYGECEYNYFPIRHAYSAALDRLHTWIRDDDPPESAPRIEREAVDPAEVDETDVLPGGGDGNLSIDNIDLDLPDPKHVVDVATDEFGNAKGGIRLPPIEVPVAIYDARSEDCYLYGRTERFDAARLEERYGSKAAYLAEFEAAAQAAVEAGYLLEPDAEDLLERAKTIDDLA